MDINYLNRFSIFNGLTEKQLEIIHKEISIKILRSGEELFHYQDEDHSLYFIYAGKLQVLLPTQKNTKLLSIINHGTCLGEVSFLTKQNRSASVIAMRDSIVFQLSSEAVENIVKQIPEFGIRLGKLASQNLLNERKPSLPKIRIRNIAWIPLELNFLGMDLLNNFVEKISLNNSVHLVNREKFLESFVSEKKSSDNNLWQKEIETLSDLEEQTDYIVYYAFPNDGNWINFCIRQADLVLFYGNTKSSINLYPILQSPKPIVISPFVQHRVLVLTHDKNKEKSQLFSWLDVHSDRKVIQVPNDTDIASDSLVNALEEEKEGNCILRQNYLFKELSVEQLSLIQLEMEYQNLPGGAVLFEKGDAANELFVVINGHLCAVSEEPESKVLREIGKGEIVGEMAILGNAPRAARVIATRDSTVGILTRKAIDSFSNSIPEFHKQIASLAIRRLQEIPDKEHTQQHLILTLVPLGNSHNWNIVSERIQQILSNYGSCFLINSSILENETGLELKNFDWASSQFDWAFSQTVIKNWLEKIELQYNYIIFLCDLDDSPWNKIFLRQTDRILWLANAGKDNRVRNIEYQWSEKKGFKENDFHHLLLFHPNDTSTPSNTRFWLNTRTWISMHHHIRNLRIDDIERTIRIIIKRAYGLTLGGASTRAISYLGIINALKDNNYPIDIISGSSSGAGIAGLVAMDLSQEENFQKTLNMNLGFKFRPWHYTYPIVSIQDGKKAKILLKEMYGDVNLEDLIIPTFIPAADLKQRRLIYFKYGTKLWWAVRSSGSLPILWPPVVTDDHVFVDSGVMNNLPAEVLYPYCEKGWLFIADVSGGSEENPLNNVVSYGDTVSGWKVFFDKKNSYPSIFDLLVQCMCLERFNRQVDVERREKSQRSSVLRPSIGTFGMFDVTDPEKIKQIIQTTYNYTIEHIEGIPHPGIITKNVSN